MVLAVLLLLMVFNDRTGDEALCCSVLEAPPRALGCIPPLLRFEIPRTTPFHHHHLIAPISSRSGSPFFFIAKPSLPFCTSVTIIFNGGIRFIVARSLVYLSVSFPWVSYAREG